MGGAEPGWIHTCLSHRVGPLVGMGFENGATIGLADKLEGSSPIEIFIQLKTFTIRERPRQSFDKPNCLGAKTSGPFLDLLLF